MPVKYECPKCGRRFTEWGAEKVGFKCPKDQWCTKSTRRCRTGPCRSSDEGFSAPSHVEADPRKIAQPKVHVVELDEDEARVPDIEEIEADDEFEEEEEDEVIVVDGAEAEAAAPEADEAAVTDDIDDDADADVDDDVVALEDDEIADDEEIT